MRKFKKLPKYLFIFISIFCLFNYKVIRVSGNSMHPNLKNGTFAIVDLYLHKLFKIEKNDYLLLKVQEREVVKKIVGFPDERIEIFDKKISLSNNEIYVLGENLKESIDSRDYGPLDKKQILGKVVISF